MAVSVNLDAIVIPDDHKVFKFFPGRDYEFYDLVGRSGIAFIDVRGLGPLGDPSNWKDDALLNQISTDRVNRAVEAGEPRPTRLVRSQGDKATLTFLKGLLFTAKKGDFILMPQKGYTTDVRIGQLLDEPGKVVQVKDGHDLTSNTYFGRRVKWIGAIEKRKFSDHLVKLLHSRAPFFDVGRSEYEGVYRLTFDNFVYDDQYFATFRTGKAIFTPKDNFLTSVWLELFEVLEEARETSAKLPAGTIYDLVIASDIQESDRDDLSISVQSPGWFRIRSIVVAPLASLALFAMAAQGVAYDQAVAATTAAVVIHKADDSCMGDVDASVRDYIKLLGKDRWEQACRLAKQAESEAKLTAGATVVQSKTEED